MLEYVIGHFGGKLVECSLRVRRVGDSIPGRVNPKSQKCVHVATLVNVQHLRAKTKLVGMVTV